MRQIKTLFVGIIALALVACSNPQYLLHPGSNPAATSFRQGLDNAMDTSLLKPVVWGSFLFPSKGAYFKPLLPTDSRNAIVYVYRPQSAWNDAEVQAPGFFLNGKFLSGLKSGSFFWLEVPGSTYYFNAKRPFTLIYLKTIFEVDMVLEGGKSYFFRYDEENPGPTKVVKGSSLLVIGPLRQMPDAQGRLEIAQTRSMGVGNVLYADKQPQWSPFDLYANPVAIRKNAADITTKLPDTLDTGSKLGSELIKDVFESEQAAKAATGATGATEVGTANATQEQVPPPEQLPPEAPTDQSSPEEAPQVEPERPTFEVVP
jgi:hypothetical protein